MEVTSVCLASADAPDKILKGAGALAKITYLSVEKKSLLDFANATSDARSLLRVLSFLSNIQIVGHALKKDRCDTRDVMYLIRIIGEGIFKVCDNVAYIGRKFQGDNLLYQQFNYSARSGLFGGYLAAVALNLYDLWYDHHFGNRKKQYVKLFQNSCDLLTAASGIRFAGFELSIFWNSLLTLISSFLGIVESFRAAAVLTRRKTGKNE